MIDNKLARLDQRIQLLKKRKEKLYTQIAVAYLKETERIFGKEFSLELILEMLDHLKTISSEIHKEEWKKHGHSFRPSPPHKNGKNTSPIKSIAQQN
jgi:hypothetical protein